MKSVYSFAVSITILLFHVLLIVWKCQFFEIAERNGFRENKSLNKVASDFLQHTNLLRQLYAFRYGFHLQRLCHSDDCFYYGYAAPIIDQRIFKENFVEF